MTLYSVQCHTLCKYDAEILTNVVALENNGHMYQ